MKNFLTTVALILMFRQWTQAQTGTVEGIVTGTDLMTPLAGVHLQIEENFPSARLQKPLSAETTTDGGGHFTFKDLPASGFTLQASLDGYLGKVQDIRLSAGEHQPVTGLVLTAASTIRGRVLDSEELPVKDGVVILQQHRDERGNASWRGLGRFIPTDEKGEYQIPSLAPGDYYLRTDAGRVYFPGTVEASTAVPISLREGMDVIADIRIPKAVDTTTFKISGKVAIPFAHSNAFDRIQVQARPLGRSGLEDPLWATVDEPSGLFDIRAVRPGSYELFVSVMNAGKGYFAKLPVDVFDHDVEDVSLALIPGVDVRAHLEIDGGPQDLLFARPPERIPASVLVREDPSTQSAANIRVTLKPRDVSSGINPAAVNDTGKEAVFEDLPEGDYDFSINIEPGRPPLNPDFYVEDVLIAGRSVYDSGIRIGREPEDVQIVIGTRGGSIEGNIPGKRNNPATVLLIPETFRRNNPALFRKMRITSSEESPSVQLRGIAPGNYKIFAVAGSDDDLPYMSVEFISRYESRAVRVVVEKGAVSGGIRIPLLPLER